MCQSVLTECLSSRQGIPPKVFFSSVFVQCSTHSFHLPNCVCVCIEEVGGGETGRHRVFVDRETNALVKSQNTIETVWSFYPIQLLVSAKETV